MKPEIVYVLKIGVMIIHICIIIDKSLFALDKVLAEFAPIVVEIDGAQVQDGLGAGRSPSHTCTLGAIFD